MKRATKILKGTSGLNQKFDSARLSEQLGNALPLATAINVDIDNTGRITTASGYNQVLTGNWHSLYSSKLHNHFFGVKDDVLVQVDENLAITELFQDVTTRVSYIATYNGVQEEVFFCTGVINGVIKDATVLPWGLITPTEPVGVIKYAAVPTGKLLGSVNGRIFVAKDNVLFWTQPFAFYCMNPLDYAQFDSPIQTLSCLDDGIWIGTLTGIYFLAGRNPKDFTLYKKLDAKVVADSAVIFDLQKSDKVSRYVILTTAKNGIYFLDGGGNCYPVTYDKIEFPFNTKGFAYVSNDKYTVYMED